MFDPEEFGRAMGEAIRKAVEPLHAKIAELEKQLAAVPAPVAGKDGQDGRDGKDCDMEEVRRMVDAAVKALPAPAAGKDGADGKDGVSVTIEDVRPLIADAVKAIQDEAMSKLGDAIKALPVPKDGKDGRDGIDGKDGRDGEKGERGSEGVGLAGAMIDRAGELVVTMSNGEAKNLGPVVGKDGQNGKDGADGMSLESFDLEYLEESHEVRIKASAAGRVKEVRFPAGGIRPGGYWREGTKAQAGEAWVHDGSMFIAKHPTTIKPDAKSEDWIIAARRGRDGETTVRHVKDGPPEPIKLKG